MSTPLSAIQKAGLLDQFDSAFLLMDFDRLDNRLGQLLSAFSSKARHAIAIKTNPMKSVLSHIVQSGLMLEAASFEELVLAEESGAKANQLVFDSPVKRVWELEACARRWPGMVVNANNLTELPRLAALSELSIGLRINALVETTAHEHYNVSHVSSKFGVPIQQREEIIRACVEFPITGLHMHSGSGVTGALDNVPAVEKIVALAEEINRVLAAASIERRIDFLDIGGGLSASVDQEEMRIYGAAVSAIPYLEKYRIITEFGQWVHTPIGSAYSVVESVDGVGKFRPQAYLHLGADFLMRHIYSQPRKLQFNVYDRHGLPKDRGECFAIDLVGPLCFAGDVLAENVLLPVIDEGYWIEIADVGANTYGLWSRHCSRAVPKIISCQQQVYKIEQERAVIPF